MPYFSKQTVVALVLLLLVGVALFLFRDTPETPESIPTQDNPGDAVMGWETFSDPDGRFQFRYPQEVSIAQGILDGSWMRLSTSTGELMVQATIADSFEPRTNFREAIFTIGRSNSPVAVSSCLTSTFGNEIEESTRLSDGETFATFVYSDAGAGNRYETTSSRMLKDEYCYALEYTIYSTSIENYAIDSGVSEFNRERVLSILESMADSFRFGNQEE